MDLLAISIMCIGLIGLYAFRTQIGVPSSQSLLPFQAGMLYRRGRPIREVGPGRHRIFNGVDKILFLDTRPIQVKVDHRAVSLPDGTTVIYGFIASAQVRDVKKAIYASANYNTVPAFVTLCVARRVLGQCQSDAIKTGKATLTDEILTVSRSLLAASGFELLSFSLTELTIAPSASSK